MKKVLLTTLMALLFASYAMSQWQPANNGINEDYINEITVEPITGDLYAATKEGVYKSTDEGASWIELFSGIEIKSIVLSGSNIFAATFGNGVYYSSDGGDSWFTANFGLSSSGLYTSTIMTSGSNLFLGTINAGIYYSNNNGGSWTPINTGISGAGLQVKSICISGSDIFAGTSGGVFLSSDNGSTWTAKSNGLSFMGSYVNSFAISGDSIFAGTSGGVFLSTDNGNNWTAKNKGLKSDGVNISSIESVSISGKYIFAGTTYYGMYGSTDGGNNWVAINKGLDLLELIPITTKEGYIYAGTQGEGIWKRLISDLGKIAVSTNSIHFADSSNSTKTFNITSNTDWIITNPQPWWVEVNPSSGTGNATITISVSANTTPVTRRNTLTIAGDELLSQTVEVSQPGIGPWQEDGLIAYYPFTNNANDQSGNGNIGTVNGATPTEDRFGKPNNAYLFNGINSNIDVQYQFGDQTESQYTVSMWVKGAAEQEVYAKLLSFPRQADNWIYPYHGLALSYYRNAYDNLEYSFSYFNETDFSGSAYTTAIEPDIWQFLVFTFDNGEAKLYVNNELMYTKTIEEKQLHFPDNGLSIGSKTINQAYSGEFFKGAIDEIRLYNRSLTSSEIQLLYHDDGFEDLTDIDGNTYNTVTIGEQTWMAENLKATKYQNGDAIGTTTPATLDTSGETEPKYQWAYDGDENYVEAYGRLYTWHTATDNRNVCPTGWYLPSEEEWAALNDYLTNNGYGYQGSGEDIAKSMAATSGWNADPTAGNAGNDQASNNSSGFSALAAGIRNVNGSFNTSEFGDYTYWWSSTESSLSPTSAITRQIAANANYLEDNLTVDKSSGLSIRCIKDIDRYHALRAQDSLALVALFNATDGANWTDNTNWLSSEPMNHWYGVIVESNRVTSLYLYSNGLSGSIPPEIGNLANLKHLGLSYNQLTGIIPVEIGNLSNLIDLNIANNELAGSIPVEIGNLKRLISLQLYSNQLTGPIPAEIGNLENLRNLTLSYNQLSGAIPLEFWSLSNLTQLFMDSNQLSGSIPAEVGNLTNLTVISLRSNELSGSIPPEIGDLSDLGALQLSNNKLSGVIPSEIGSLTDLSSLTLDNNQLSGSIPTGIWNLTSLDNLSLTHNQLSGELPVEIGNLSGLYKLALGDNQLSGSIPTEIGDLSNLRELYLWGNEFTGTIPTSIGNLANLENLELSSNLLTGIIPAEIGDLTNLEVLYLWGNALSGAIPAEIGYLSNLTELALSNNELTGTIPTEIQNLTNLTYLSLSNNQVSGIIPTEIGFLSNLMNLYLSGNKLSGTIPAEIGNLSNLTVLYLWGNEISGEIPAEIGNLSNLVKLSFSSNELTGTIPSEIWDLTNLTYLSLTNNQLSGTISPEIRNLSVLNTLALGGNELTGTIPREIGDLSNLREMYLWGNELYGTIPSQIGNLTNLEYLSLQGNSLSGSIPTEINNCSGLKKLRLNNNDFNSIPVFTQSTLDSLWIEYNQFYFDDIISNMNVPNNYYSYAPQDSIEAEELIYKCLKSEFTYDISDNQQQNQYSWYHNDILMTDAESNPLEIDYLQKSDSGSYHCIITNPLAPDLTLYTRQKTVNFHPSPEPFSITGQIDVPEYAIIVYSVPSNPEVDYYWYSTGGNILSYATDNSAQIQWGSPGTGFVNSYAINSYGCVSDTSVKQINIVSTTGFSELENDDIRIYPNPTHGLIKIEYSRGFAKSELLEIFNSFGNCVKTLELKQIDSQELDLSDLPKGIYFLKFRNTRTFKKIIIQ